MRRHEPCCCSALSLRRQARPWLRWLPVSVLRWLHSHLFDLNEFHAALRLNAAWWRKQREKASKP